MWVAANLVELAGMRSSTYCTRHLSQTTSALWLSACNEADYLCSVAKQSKAEVGVAVPRARWSLSTHPKEHQRLATNFETRDDRYRRLVRVFLRGCMVFVQCRTSRAAKARMQVSRPLFPQKQNYGTESALGDIASIPGETL